MEDARDYATAASVVLSGIGIVSILVTALYGTASSSVIYLIKFFNILDVVSNLGDLNVKFGSAIQIVLNFVNNIRIPEIKFLARLSPIKGSYPDSKDSSAYLTVIRGSRAKMTQENGQVFIASG